MRENRTHGSEGGETRVFPTPINTTILNILNETIIIEMSNYIRSKVRGGTYFLTVNILDRSNRNLLIRHVGSLRQSVRVVKGKYPFKILAWVVLPDHFHCLIELPEADSDYSTRVRLVKLIFAKTIPVAEQRTETMIRRKERGIWQRRFWEHTIQNERDLAAHMDYIHYNPVKHGLVRQVRD